MENKRNGSNVIVLLHQNSEGSTRRDGEIEAADVNEFIVDMLDTLMKDCRKKREHHSDLSIVDGQTRSTGHDKGRTERR